MILQFIPSKSWYNDTWARFRRDPELRTTVYGLVAIVGIGLIILIAALT